jgi:DNA invertase Pin-like site-specific DNA recombinase
MQNDGTGLCSYAPIRDKSRKRSLMYLKMSMSYKLVQSGVSRRRIARMLGLDRTTITHHIKTVQNQLSTNKELREVARKIKAI